MEQGKTDWQSLLEQGVRLKIIGDSIGAGSGTSDDNRSGPVFFHMEGKVYKRQLGKKGWAARLAAYVET
ncbi:MAG: hypothetical protein LUE63_03525, partial [Lachnospiraceae bacterium]|nr:hypothetical protein [Lachnospiraceae bacterium]